MSRTKMNPMSRFRVEEQIGVTPFEPFGFARVTKNAAIRSAEKFARLTPGRGYRVVDTKLMAEIERFRFPRMEQRKAIAWFASSFRRGDPDKGEPKTVPLPIATVLIPENTIVHRDRPSMMDIETAYITNDQIDLVLGWNNSEFGEINSTSLDMTNNEIVYYDVKKGNITHREPAIEAWDITSSSFVRVWAIGWGWCLMDDKG